MTCGLSSPGRERVGIPSEAEEGPSEGARRRDSVTGGQETICSGMGVTSQ